MDTASVCCHLGEELVLCTATNYVDHLSGLAVKSLDCINCVSVLESERFVNATNNFANCFGNVLTCHAAVVANLFGHVTGSTECVVVGVDKGLEGLAFLCPSFHLSEAVVLTFSLPLTSGFLDNPKTHDVLEESDSTKCAAFVCEVSLSCCVVDKGLLELATHERPCTAGYVDEVVVSCRNGDNCACSIVGSNCNNVDIVLTNLFVDLRKKTAKRVSGLNERSEERTLNADSVCEIVSEISLCSVKDHTCGCDGVFCCHLACEEVVEKVGDEEHLVSSFKHFEVVSSVSCELVESVEVTSLNTCNLVDFLRGNKLLNVVCNVYSSCISVVRRVSHHSAVLIEKCVVNAPCVDTHACYVVTVDNSLCDGVFDFKEYSENIPCESAVYEYGVVRKSVIFSECELFAIE